jgi:hypothetical protein
LEDQGGKNMPHEELQKIVNEGRKFAEYWAGCLVIWKGATRRSLSPGRVSI